MVWLIGTLETILFLIFKLFKNTSSDYLRSIKKVFVVKCRKPNLLRNQFTSIIRRWRNVFFKRRTRTQLS